MKRIAFTLVIWLLVACAVIAGGVATYDAFTASTDCMGAQMNYWYWQRFPDMLPYSTTRAALVVEAACGVQHGVVPVQLPAQVN